MSCLAFLMMSLVVFHVSLFIFLTSASSLSGVLVMIFGSVMFALRQLMLLGVLRLASFFTYLCSSGVFSPVVVVSLLLLLITVWSSIYSWLHCRLWVFFWTVAFVDGTVLCCLSVCVFWTVALVDCTVVA